MTCSFISFSFLLSYYHSERSYLLIFCKTADLLHPPPVPANFLHFGFSSKHLLSEVTYLLFLIVSASHENVNSMNTVTLSFMSLYSQFLEQSLAHHRCSIKVFFEWRIKWILKHGVPRATALMTSLDGIPSQVTCGSSEFDERQTYIANILQTHYFLKLFLPIPSGSLRDQNGNFKVGSKKRCRWAYFLFFL